MKTRIRVNITARHKLKQEFISLYNQRHSDFKSVHDRFSNGDLSVPFLMSPNDDYCIQTNKLLVIGQETNGWSNHVDNLEMQMQTYESFNLGVNYNSSPFWSITRKLENAFGNKLYSCAWSNLNKFELKRDKRKENNQEIISKLDDILLAEIKILSPDFCIFFTGPFFDTRLKIIFKNIEFLDIPGFLLRQFCKLKHPDLPGNSFRSYHPKALRIQHLESGFVEYLAKHKKRPI